MSLNRVFDALDADWALVCVAPGRGSLVRGWLLECGALDGNLQGGLDDVLPELTCRERGQGRAFSDRWLYAVLRRAGGEGDEAQLAARVVVQAMLPAAVRLTGRLKAGRDFDETAQVVVSCLYRVVRTYPMARRRGSRRTSFWRRCTGRAGSSRRRPGRMPRSRGTPVSTLRPTTVRPWTRTILRKLRGAACWVSRPSASVSRLTRRSWPVRGVILRSCWCGRWLPGSWMWRGPG